MTKIESFWKDAEFYFTLLLLMFLIYVLTCCFSLNNKARFIPLIVTIGILPLTVFSLLGTVLPSVKAKVQAMKSIEIEMGSGKVKGVSEQPAKKKEEPLSEVLQLVYWFGGAFVVFFFAGYLPMIIAFCLFFLKLRVGHGWLKSAAYTALFSLLTWAIFTLVLGLAPFGVEYYY